MSEIKWIRHEFEQSVEISRLEWDSIIRHCLWSQNPDQLCAWLDDTPGGDLVIHIAGVETTPVVLKIDPDGPIHVMEGPTMRDLLEIPNERIEYRRETTKGEAIRILGEGHVAPHEEHISMARAYIEVLQSRIEARPFVYLTVRERALPLDVPDETS